MIPPPRVLCRRISSGSAGSKAGSLDKVSCDPIAMANALTTMPTKGPAIEISNIVCLFLGSSLKVVTELVIPVMIEGTNVGTDSLTCRRFADEKQDLRRFLAHCWMKEI